MFIIDRLAIKFFFDIGTDFVPNSIILVLYISNKSSSSIEKYNTSI